MKQTLNLIVIGEGERAGAVVQHHSQRRVERSLGGCSAGKHLVTRPTADSNDDRFDIIFCDGRSRSLARKQDFQDGFGLGAHQETCPDSGVILRVDAYFERGRTPSLFETKNDPVDWIYLGSVTPRGAE